LAKTARRAIGIICIKQPLSASPTCTRWEATHTGKRVGLQGIVQAVMGVAGTQGAGHFIAVTETACIFQLPKRQDYDLQRKVIMIG